MIERREITYKGDLEGGVKHPLHSVRLYQTGAFLAVGQL
jgi:hypothetical protein